MQMAIQVLLTPNCTNLQELMAASAVARRFGCSESPASRSAKCPMVFFDRPATPDPYGNLPRLGGHLWLKALVNSYAIIGGYSARGGRLSYHAFRYWLASREVGMRNHFRRRPAL